MDPMISALLALAILGFVLWAVLQIPMPEPFKKILWGLAVLLLVIWLVRYLVPLVR